MKKILIIAFLLSAIMTVVLLLICSTALAYVGNRNTRKFHEDYCDSVRAMADHNKVYIESREDAIVQGYIPCKRCRP